MTSSSRPRRNVPAPGASAAGASASGTAGHKSSPYARFIPREELSSFAAWSPGDLSGRTAAPEVRESTPDELAGIAALHHAAQVKQARQSGYQDGYRDGLVALEGFKQSFANQATQQVGALLQSVGGQLDGLQQAMAEALIGTVTKLARQVVRSELKQRPDAVASVAREALDTLLLSARHITLRVHPDDHALVADGASEVLTARGARLVSDPSIVRGGCLVDSSIGLIDATVETRWRRAIAGLGRDEAWHEADVGAGSAEASDGPDGAPSSRTSDHARASATPDLTA